MSQISDSFAKLPIELLIEILSQLVPYNVRELRYLVLACPRSSHQIVGTAAEIVLQNQRVWLLDRWWKIYKTLPILPEAVLDVRPVAELVIGKQYVESGPVDERDAWVSVAMYRFLSTSKTRLFHF